MTAWNAIKQAPRKLGEAAANARPHLVGINSPPRRMSSLMFGVVMVAILVAGLVGVLVLSTALQTREFELRAKQRTASELAYQVSDLESKVYRANAPRELGRRATALGMVPNSHPVFIDLGNGSIQGSPVPATGNEIPSLRVTGSAAARRLLPADTTSVVPLRLLALYAASPRRLAEQLGLVEADAATANVVIVAPQDERILPGPGEPADLAPTALVLADLLTLPGRSDAEAEQLMDALAATDPSWKE